MRALHFGAGNIGRGFIGKVLLDSGFNVIFSDSNIKLVEEINNYKKYTIQLVDKDKEETVIVKNISAIHTDDIKIIKIISTVSIITTAVGFNMLNDVAKKIVQGIVFKYSSVLANTFLNIIACENNICASSYLKTIVLEKLPIKYHIYLEEYVGFVDCSVDKIIPYKSINQKNSLFLITEYFQEWIVNSTQFKGEIPKICGMILSDNLIAFVERKLFTLNTGHAVAAYLGVLQKYQTIHESISDKKIRDIVKGAMKESGNFLIKHFGLNPKDHVSYINKIFLRFENPFIIDKLERVARNPLQKLKKNGRLIRPLLGTIKYYLSHMYLIKGIAAALHYYDKNDLESIKMQDLIKKIGISKTLSTISGLNINSLEIHEILKEYIFIKTEYK